MILKEFDPSKEAIINPWDVIKRVEGFPETVVSCFARSTFNKILDSFEHEEIAHVSIANLRVPIYVITFNGKRIGIFNSYVGAAGCVGILEEIIVMGMKNLVIFGTCGVLDASIKDTSIIVPDVAIRDEGTSYHYAPASDEIGVNAKTKDSFMNMLDELNVSYYHGKVWTTDAIYRETKDKMTRRKASGAICVDMECSAVASLAEMRDINVLHFFYSADNLDTDIWDARSLGDSQKLDEKHSVSLIALDYASRMK